MTFTRLALSTTLFATLAACSGGKDVTLTAPGTQSDATAPSCEISSGEDVCSRSFDVSPEHRIDFVGYLEQSALVGGLVDELASRTFAICDAMASELDAVVALPPGTVGTDARVAVCAAVGAIVAGANPPVVHVAPPSCRPRSVPGCSVSHFPMPPIEQCDLSSIALEPPTSNSADGARAAAVHAAAVRHGADLAWVAREAKNLEHAVAVITDNVPAVTKGLSASEEICTLPATQMLKETADLLSSAMTAATSVNLPIDASQ